MAHQLEEETFRKLCQICGTPAPRNTKHYVHYGAVCCSKCKAFFRRSKRLADKLGSALPPFSCISGNNDCTINYENVDKCKKCRLIKCIAAGMDGNMVLNEIQRVKYRHCYKRKPHNSSSSEYSRTSSSESSSEAQMPDLIPILKLQDKSAKVDEVLKHFLLSLAELKFESECSDKLSGFHQKKAFTFPWDFLIVHLNSYASQLTRFAQQITDFQLLPCQDELLDLATNMYMHYILAKYLSSTSGSEQLHWLFDGHLDEVFSYPPNGEVQTISQASAFAFLSEMLEPESINVYIQCIKCISQREFPKACNGLVAHFLLYQNYAICQDECNRHRIEELERQAADFIIEECANVGIMLTVEDLEDFSGALQMMAQLLDLKK